jgi:glycosyltransferase involved in cell wall biosynthesis
MTEKISVIITARNNGKYLAEAIESCFNQSVFPYEIIYSDDYSTDDSVKVAKKFKSTKKTNFIVVTHKEHQGVVKARNSGADKSTGDILVFLDGDDIMPKDFLKLHLEVLTEKTPFVYCAAQAFGNFSCFWRVRPFAEFSLWHRNFVNTSAMMWRWAFIAAGKWQETCENTMWDWSLAIRMSRLGKPVKSSAVLHYRQHNDSWSLKKEKSENRLIQLSSTIRRDLVNMTIGVIYSGRLNENFTKKFIDSIVDDIKILTNKPQLIIINNSLKDINFIKEYSKHFSNIKIITGKQFTWQTEIERRNKVCELLSDQYNRILENATGELIHFREDDIIPNKDSFKKIFDYVTYGNPIPNAVAGIYLNRNLDRKKVVGGFYNTQNPRQTSDITDTVDTKPFTIDYTGTGFLIFWKELCPIFEPYIDGIQAHDWAWGLKLKKNKGRLIMLPEAICKHYKTETEFVEFHHDIDINNVNTFTKPTYNFNGAKKTATVIIN